MGVRLREPILSVANSEQRVRDRPPTSPTRKPPRGSLLPNTTRLRDRALHKLHRLESKRWRGFSLEERDLVHSPPSRDKTHNREVYEQG